MFEPIWNRNYVVERADHDGRGVRRRGPRPLLRPGRRAARRRRQPPHAGGRRRGDGAARGRRPRDPQGRAVRRVPGDAGRGPRALRPRPARRLPHDRGRRRGLQTETYAALRLEIDNWRWAGVPFFIRTGKCLPITQTELRLVFRQPPRLGFRLRGRACRSPTSSSSGSIPTTGIQRARRGAARQDQSRPSRSRWTWSSRRREARARRPTRCCSTPRWSATAPASRARTASRRPGGCCSRCWTTPPPVHPYAKGSWGPAAADKLLAGHGRWHEPWVGS